jgi:cytochrome P450
LLAWSFHLLGEHPKVYGRLRSELDASAGKHPHLLDEVIKEALRLYPPIHMGNRVVTEPVEFDGTTVPSGERIIYSIYLTHRDGKIWEKPDEFCPERFEHGRKTPPMSYVPFGGGPRACIGAAFGLAEARVVISELLLNFDFEPCGPQAHAHMGATLEPRPGVFMKITRKQTGRL